MAKTEQKSEVIKLRSKIEKNPRLNLEFRANLSSLLRQHSIDVSDEALRDLILAHPGELPPMAANPINVVERKPVTAAAKTPAKSASTKAAVPSKKK